MWCPECGIEYREGFTVCSDCGSELVEKCPHDMSVNAAHRSVVTAIKLIITQIISCVSKRWRDFLTSRWTWGAVAVLFLTVVFALSLPQRDASKEENGSDVPSVSTDFIDDSVSHPSSSPESELLPESTPTQPVITGRETPLLPGDEIDDFVVAFDIYGPSAEEGSLVIYPGDYYRGLSPADNWDDVKLRIERLLAVELPLFDVTLVGTRTAVIVNFHGDLPDSPEIELSLAATFRHGFARAEHAKILCNGQPWVSPYSDSEGFLIKDELTDISIYVPPQSELADIRGRIPYTYDPMLPYPHFWEEYPFDVTEQQKQWISLIYQTIQHNMIYPDFSSPSEIPPDFLVTACYKNTGAKWWRYYNESDIDYARYVPELAPFASYFDDYGGFVTREHMDETARLLFGETATIIHGEDSGFFVYYKQESEVYYEHGHGLYYLDYPVILDSSVNGDTVKLTVVFLRRGMEGWEDIFQRAVAEKDLRYHCDNNLPKFSLTLIRQPDDSYILYSHENLGPKYYGNAIAYRLTQWMGRFDLANLVTIIELPDKQTRIDTPGWETQYEEMTFGDAKNSYDIVPLYVDMEVHLEVTDPSGKVESHPLNDGNTNFTNYHLTVHVGDDYSVKVIAQIGNQRGEYCLGLTDPPKEFIIEKYEEIAQ